MQQDARTHEIETAVARCDRVIAPWNGTLYRMTTVGYSNRLDLLSGKGSQTVGGRWTPQGMFRSIYGSLDPHTAMAESLGNFQDRGIPISQAMPLVVVGVVAKLQAVLDVTSDAFLKPLGLTVADLTQLNWKAEQSAGREALTQAIGRCAYAADLEGIIVPSSRAPAGRNIVIFPQRRLKGSSLKIENVRDLPKRK